MKNLICCVQSVSHRASACLLLAFALLVGLVTGAEAQTIIQAESGTLSGGTYIATSQAGYTGSGYVDGFTAANSKVTFNVAVTPGLYQMSIRFSAPSGSKGYDVTVNGSTSSGTFPQNSGWSTINGPKVLLNANNTISIGAGWGWYQVDSITLASVATTQPAKPSLLAPVDPGATAEAKTLYTFLRNNYGMKTVSGQQEIADANYIQSKTGKMPGVLAQDLMDYSPSRVQYGSSPAVTSEQTIQLVGQNGQICSLIWHWNAPMHLYNTSSNPWWRGFYTDASSYDIAYALANTNSPEYQALIRDLDAIAVQLKKFQDAKVPVLWRPLHEAEGTWFWWGAKGPGPFVQLWRLMYNRFTQTHGLHNLIWVFTANSANQSWYPGDAYVDIVGTDQYPTDRTDALSTIYDELQSTWNGKRMLALSEFGGVADTAKMRQYGVYWSWTASWNGFASGYPSAELARLYSDSALINGRVNF